MGNLDEYLEGVEKASEIDARANYRVMDNHLKHTDRLIANIAALSVANADEAELVRTLEAAAENPT